MTSRSPLHAHADGFDLHAAVSIPTSDRPALERLTRYLLRPAIAQHRLELTDDGRVRVALKTPWSDGTTHFVFHPLELLGRLASLIPRPRSNLVIYHGVLAANAKGRAEIVHYGRPSPGDLTTHPVTTPGISAAPKHNHAKPSAPRPATYRPWADLMRRTFAFDVLQCDRCGGRLRLLATIHAPSAIRAILDHLNLPSTPPPLPPARSPPEPNDSWH